MQPFRIFVCVWLVITLIGATQAQTLKEALVAQDKDIYDAIVKGDANTFSSLLVLAQREMEKRRSSLV